MKRTRRLGELNPGDTGVIVGYGMRDRELVRRLMEIGFLEGSRIEVMHQAPFSGDPLAVQVRGALIAVRRSEANEIEVAEL